VISKKTGKRNEPETLGFVGFFELFSGLRIVQPLGKYVGKDLNKQARCWRSIPSEMRSHSDRPARLMRWICLKIAREAIQSDILSMPWRRRSVLIKPGARALQQMPEIPLSQKVFG